MFSAIMLGWLVTFDGNVQKLDSDKWIERERANKVVMAFVMNDIFVDRLKAVKENTKSLEVNCRINSILQRYYTVMPRNYGKIPWFDCDTLKLQAEERQTLMTRYVYSQGGCEPPEYWSYRAGTYYYFRDKMENHGWTRVQVRQEIERLVQAEKDWIKKAAQQNNGSR